MGRLPGLFSLATGRRRTPLPHFSHLSEDVAFLFMLFCWRHFFKAIAGSLFFFSETFPLFVCLASLPSLCFKTVALTFHSPPFGFFSARTHPSPLSFPHISFAIKSFLIARFQTYPFAFFQWVPLPTRAFLPTRSLRWSTVAQSFSFLPIVRLFFSIPLILFRARVPQGVRPFCLMSGPAQVDLGKCSPSFCTLLVFVVSYLQNQRSLFFLFLVPYTSSFCCSLF